MKRIYLCQPYSYSVDPEAAESRWNAAKGVPDVKVTNMRICTTGLCHSFNIGVAQCKDGDTDADGTVHPYDYFAMIHSDIQVEPGWLGVLMTAMDEKNIDVIHAPVAIKNDMGVTSTGIGFNLEPDPLNRVRHIGIRELQSLPDVFTVEDLRETIAPDAVIMLPNPGVMVMKLGQWFYDWDGFQTITKVFKRADGVHISWFVSEDYELGYYAAKHGIRIGATTRVRTHHYGRMNYSTGFGWGPDTDQTYFALLANKTLKAIHSDCFIYPYDVLGWLSPLEGAALKRLAKGKRVLEIGSYCGKSTLCLSADSTSVVSVDPHDSRGTPNAPLADTYEAMATNMKDYQVDNVTMFRGTSQEYFSQFDDNQSKEGLFDLVFIDGAHDYKSVQTDISIAERLLAPGGILAFHDYRIHSGEHDGGWNPGVTQAVDELVAAGATLVSRHGTVAVVKPAETKVAVVKPAEAPMAIVGSGSYVAKAINV